MGTKALQDRSRERRPASVAALRDSARVRRANRPMRSFAQVLGTKARVAAGAYPVVTSLFARSPIPRKATRMSSMVRS